MKNSNIVEIYTDGACSGNPGPGGYGVVILYKEKIKELSGGYTRTTNNRMELMAAIKALEVLTRPCKVNLYSDSQYIINALNKGWLNKWMNNGWMLGKKTPVKNIDLWKKIITLTSVHEIKWFWVKGHSTNKYNNRCNELAVGAAKKEPFSIDEGFS